MQKSAYEHILRHLLSLHPIFPLTEERFAGMIEVARREMPRVVARVQGAAKLVGELRSKILASGKSYLGMDADLRRLVHADFLAMTPHGQLQHLPRYLRAMEIRGERAALSPGKDEEKARQLLPFIGWEARVIESKHEEFRWMLEEFRVSIFAQELGTAQPASALRLRALGSF
jgi:ATP-dependent helicase HrpA